MTDGPVVAVGGMGGSGTRVVAAALRRLGFFMGKDLNGADDNLWFTLLFKVRDLPAWESGEVDRRLAMFLARMDGSLPIEPGVIAEVNALAGVARRHHTVDWLEARAGTFLSGRGQSHGRRWGWKEPNAHLIADRLLATRDDAVYVHVTRHGVSMAHSTNQHQTELWSRWLVGTPWDGTPAGSLRYWRAVTERAHDLAERRPGRVLLVDYDSWCADPLGQAQRLGELVEVEATGDWLSGEAAAVQPSSRRDGQRVDLEGFDPRDLEFVVSCGYELDASAPVGG